MISATLTGPQNLAISRFSNRINFDGSNVGLATDATFRGPLSKINGLTLSFGKPSVVTVDFEFPSRNMSFNMFNTGSIMEMPWRTIYSHNKGKNQTDLEGTLEIDSTKALRACYGFESRDYQLTYSYVHNRITKIQPSYDSSTISWGFAITQELNPNDFVVASFQSSSKILGFYWTRTTTNPGLNVAFKMSAALDFGGESRIPATRATSEVKLSVRLDVG